MATNTRTRNTGRRLLAGLLLVARLVDPSPVAGSRRDDSIEVAR